MEVAVELRAVRVTGRERRMPDAVLLGPVSPGRLPRRLQLLHKARHCKGRAPMERRAALGAHNELRRCARAALLGPVSCHAAQWPPRPLICADICMPRTGRYSLSLNKNTDRRVSN